MRDDERQRILVRRLDVDEVDVEPVDLRDELRQRVQPRLEPPKVVLAAPVAHELLNGRELHALCLVCDGLPFGPARRLNAPAKVDEGSSGTSRRKGRIAVSSATAVAAPAMLLVVSAPIVRTLLRSTDGCFQH